MNEYLSGLTEEEQEQFYESAEQLERKAEGFNHICSVIERVKTEELTVSEGQSRINSIINEYDLPEF